MMFNVVIVFLSLVTASTAFDVDIQAGRSTDTSRAYCTGSEVHVITGTERDTFDIQDDNLKSAVDVYFGSRPDDAYLTSPTPWEDLYKRYGWDETRTNIVPIHTEVLGVATEPVVVKTQTFSNHGSVPATFDVSVSDSVWSTVSSTWSNAQTVTMGQSITYKVDLVGGEIGGESSIEFSSEWGQSETRSTLTTVGSSSGVSVPLQPNQHIRAELRAYKGTMQVKVTYRVHLSGYTAVNYGGKHNGHHFWALGINSVMSAHNLATTKDIEEILSVGYYSDSEINLYDATSTRQILHMTANAISQNDTKPVNNSKEA